jgi:hypothetical protein
MVFYDPVAMVLLFLTFCILVQLIARFGGTSAGDGFLCQPHQKTVWLRAWVVQRREDETDDGTTLAALAPDAISLRDMSGTGRSGRRRSQSEDSNPFEDELSDDEPTASASDSGAGVKAGRRR